MFDILLPLRWIIVNVWTFQFCWTVFTYGLQHGGGIMQTVSSHCLFFQRCKNREQYYALATVFGKKKKRQTAHSQRDKRGIGWPGAGKEWRRKNLSMASSPLPHTPLIAPVTQRVVFTRLVRPYFKWCSVKILVNITRWIKGNLRSALKGGCHFVMTTHLRNRTGVKDADGAREKVLQQMKDAMIINNNWASNWKQLN